MPARFTLRLVRFLLPALSLLTVHGADAAPLPYWHSSMVHKAWTKRDGAPTAVFGITQDARGVMWFAASDGLYRFDGVRFERLTAIDGNRLRSPNTNGLLAVGNALWVGYNFGGVSVFDQGKVRHYGVEDGMSGRTVYQIVRTRNGTMWLSTSEGLYWLDGQRWRHVLPDDGLPAGGVHYFTGLPDGSILLDHPGGVYRSNAGGHRFRKVAGGPGTEIHQLLPDGRTLLVDRQRHFSRYAALDGVLSPLVFPAGVTPTDPFQDARGAMWVNTEEGLTLLDARLQPQRSFTGPEALSGKQVYNTFDDREGNFWLTTENGVDRIREARLTTIALPTRMSRALTVQAGGDGTVWVGNHRTDGNYVVASFGLRADGSRLAAPASNVTASVRAPDGGVWFANGESLWRVENGAWRTWPLPPGLRGNDVQALAQDATGGLWVSVVHNGVHLFRDGRWQAGGGTAALATRTAVSLYAEASGRTWFGYPANKLALLEGGVLRDYTAADGLDVGNVTAMTSYHGRLLVAGDQGVAVLEGTRFVPLLDAAGQSLNGVSAMLVSAGGELWLHGPDGLTRIAAADLDAALAAKPAANSATPGNPAGGRRAAVERFDYLDGYEGRPSQVRPLSVLTEAADGRLWYSTSGSVGWIDPAHILRNTQAPTAQVTALRTEQRSYDPLPGLVLPQHTDNLELDFTAAALSIPERVRFQYRLAGMDQDWHDAGARRAAYYTNLGPGDYRFEVMAVNEDGVASSAPGTLAFRIAPAFVQTAWFKLLCGVLALALLALLYWWRLALLTRRIADRLRERLRERERIARALHDNFLQSVQALMMQFNRIQRRLPAEDPAQAEIDAALATAEEVLCEGREQVLSLRISHELTGDLETALSGLGHILAPRHGARFSLRVTGVPRPLRAMAAAEAYAIAREALLNACRHARSDEIGVELRHTRSHFILQVRDRGRGMSADVHARGHRPGHFGLAGMRERARDAGGALDIHSVPGQGTEVTLRLPARHAYARARERTKVPD